AAMEQKADNIFILCKGWGDMRMATEDAKTLRDLEPGGGGEMDPEERARKEAIAEESNREARRILEEDNAKRKAKGLPPRVISNWRSYVKSLGLPWPNWGSFIVRFKPEELLDHLEKVYEVHYEPEDLKEPSINFVVLVNEDANSDPSENQLKKIAKEFRGSVGIFRGSKTPQELLKQMGEESPE
ncbi:MAG TPA: hypothetical protein VJ904_04155, partial [Tichowtungia sp.]|nr:hypothetical protein [Tichowtungia sp.]